MSLVTFEQRDHLCILTLDNPARRNALSAALVESLVASFETLSAMDCRGVILRSTTPEGIWSAGYDIAELPATPRDPLGWSAPLRNAVDRVERFPFPVVAAIDGSVWGGAVELVLACDVIIATPTATFAYTPARLSIPYNLPGLTSILARLPPALARELVFTGDPLGAPRAHQVGLINHIVPPEQLLSTAETLARRMAENAPLTISAMKLALRRLTTASLLPLPWVEEIQAMRQHIADSEDYREGLVAFAEKRRPDFQGR